MVYQKNFLRPGSARLLPGACFLCHGATDCPSIICGPCKNDLPRVHAACKRCGRARTTTTGSCSYCLLSPPAFDQAITSFLYNFPIDEIIRQLKYHGKIFLAQELGLELAEHLLKVGASLPECIIPVPLFWRRHLSRGFNQASELAGIVSEQIMVPVESRLVRRSLNTLAQFRLGMAARKRNLKNAFTLTTKPHYEHVAIIDDLITTGATISEIARLLKTAGVKRVDGWACARAEPE